MQVNQAGRAPRPFAERIGTSRPFLGLLLIIIFLAGCSASAERTWLNAPGWERALWVGQMITPDPVSLALDGEGGVYLLTIENQEGASRPHVLALDRRANALWERTLDVRLSRPASPRIVWDGQLLHLFWLDDGQLFGAQVDTAGNVIGQVRPLLEATTMNAFDADVDGNGRLALWAGGSRREPGLYAIPVEEAGAEPILVDPQGSMPKIRFDDDGTLHAVWRQFPSGASESRVFYASEAVGGAVSGEATQIAAPRVAFTSSFDGPYFGLDDQHAYVMWTIVVNTGPAAGTAQTEMVTFPVGEPSQISEPRTLLVPAESELPYEAQPGTSLQAGSRVSLAGQGRVVPMSLMPDHRSATELVVAAQANVAYQLRNQANQATLLYFRDGAPSGYQLLSFSAGATLAPYVISDDAGYLYATWLERSDEGGFLVYFSSTAPDLNAELSGLTVDDVGRMALETIFGMLSGVALSPFTAVLWLIAPLVVLGLTSFLRRESEERISLGSAVSLLLSLLSFWLVKFTSLPGSREYVPFSAWIPILPSALEGPLRWGVLISITIVALLTAWHFTYRRRNQSALYFMLIYSAVDSALTMAIYGTVVYGFI